MHIWDKNSSDLLKKILQYVKDRLKMDPPPLDHTAKYDDLYKKIGKTITENGLGGKEALKLFKNKLAPYTLSIDHPRYLSFIPSAPTESSTLFDLVVSASSIYGGSWMEGAGAIYAETEALNYLIELAGLPKSAGGVFVSGGTQGNLGALVAARNTALLKRKKEGLGKPRRWVILISNESHSSLKLIAEVMDIDVLEVMVEKEGPQAGRLNGDKVRSVLNKINSKDAVFALSACMGTTNYGIVDDLSSLGLLCKEQNWWFHVDGAYGGAGMADPNLVELYRGIELCDSFIVDPHKWLFAPFDSCALVYRNPYLARLAHSQKAGYLDILHENCHPQEINPSEYAVHLSRRARGLPFWFSLITHGTKAYREAIQTTLKTTKYAVSEIEKSDYLELVRTVQLSVVVFRRLGWKEIDYKKWSENLLVGGVAFVTPTKHYNETVTRFAIVNPRTSNNDIDVILKTMK